MIHLRLSEADWLIIEKAATSFAESCPHDSDARDRVFQALKLVQRVEPEVTSAPPPRTSPPTRVTPGMEAPMRVKDFRKQYDIGSCRMTAILGAMYPEARTAGRRFKHVFPSAVLRFLREHPEFRTEDFDALREQLLAENRPEQA